MEDNKLGGKYSWKVGGYNFKADANLIGQEIETIVEKTPENIVDYARNSETELHKVFEWDDHVASEMYRKQQATAVLNNLVFVVRADVNSVAHEIKAFVNTKKHDEYKPIQYVLKSPSEYALLKEKARKKLISARNEFAEITEYQEIYNLIDEICN